MTLLIIAALWWRRAPANPEMFQQWSTDRTWRTQGSDIEYVGSKACLECHREAAESFSLTGMAHSAARLPDASIEKAVGNNVVMTTEFPFAYQIAAAGGQLIVTERGGPMPDSPPYEQSEPLWLVVGSGAHARTGGILRPDGYLFQSPVTWYRSLNAWAMSPGYDRLDHRRFTRELLEDCLFCHTGRLQHVDGTRNRFLWNASDQEWTIGCERCHGPGKQHVDFQWGKLAGTDRADFIVNPAKLDWGRANDVCLQCHRGGQHGLEVERPGRNWSDFRPGMPLAAIVQRFAENGANMDAQTGVHFNGKLSQLERSRCFGESKGKLHCLSCHSIHHRPAPAHRVEHYRKACLACHDKPGCALPEARRRQQAPDDSCVACHMPVSTPSDVPHTTITDHRIRKPAGASARAAGIAADGRLEPMPGLAVPETEERRNLAIAYANRGGETNRAAYHEQAVRLLEANRAERSGDVRSALVHGLSLASLGRYRQAVPILQEAVRLDDNLEAAHNALATCSHWSGQRELSAGHVRRSLEINPHRLDMLLLAARQAMDASDRKTARTFFERALAISRGNPEAQLGLRQLRALGH